MANLTTAAFAQQVELSPARVNQMLRRGEIPGEKFGDVWMIDEKYVQIVRDRPEKRGRRKKIEEKEGAIV